MLFFYIPKNIRSTAKFLIRRVAAAFQLWWKAETRPRRTLCYLVPAMKVSPYIYLVFSFVWLGIAIDRLFFHPASADVTYLALFIGVVSLGQFVWVKRRT